MNAKNILFLDSMLTPRIITFVYWLALFGVAVSALGTIFVGGLSFGKFLMGVGILVGGGIGVRIWCELLIVLFKIHENIKKIAEKG